MSTHNVANFPGHRNAGFQLGNNQGNIENININSNTADSDCLKALRLTDPRDDKNRIRDTKGGLLLDSSRWILEHQDFRKWHDEDQSQLLWIKGDPGKGKTMLMIGIAEELERQLEQFGPPERTTTSPPTVLAYFFCQGTDSNLNNGTAILRGLIFLLAIQHQSLTKHLRKEYDNSGSKLFEGSNAFFALSRILGNMLRDPILTRAYILIDALDECDMGLEQLLRLVTERASTSSVKWIVSSRNIPQIAELLEPADDKIRLSLELNHESTAAAVGMYITHKVSELTRVKRYDSATECAIRDYLCKNADDTFLWVALVCQNLLKVRRLRAQGTLTKFPPGLGPLYERMMKQIEKEDQEDVDLCHRILATVALVYRPVTLAELGSLVELPNTISSCTEELMNFIELCGSFLTVRDERVYIIHLSAKDYLEDKAAATIFPHGRPEAHHGIFIQSLRTMENVLHRDMYGPRVLASTIHGVKTPDPDPLVTIRYPCIYWVDHLDDASQDVDLADVEAIYEFFEKHILNWIEALSHLSNLGTGIVAAAKMLSMAEANIRDDNEQSPKLAKLVELAYDLWRFLRQFKIGLEAHPLQAHLLAVVFTPTHSLIKQLSHEGEARWFSTGPLMQRYWSACLQTLEGHETGVVSLASSGDGKWVASATNHQEVGVWDLATGECVKMLQRNHSNMGLYGVSPIALSPDGRRIASGYIDGTVLIWDLATGECLKVLEGHDRGIESVAFCHDTEQMVSVSGDAMLKIWDTATGECIRTQTRVDRPGIPPIALSPDGKWLVLVSEQSDTIHVSDVATGRDQRVLAYPSKEAVELVAFSPGSKRVVAGFRNGMVGLWDVLTGGFQQILEGIDENLYSVAFSPDGRKVVAGYGGGEVRICDATNGGCLQTFKSYGDGVISVIFSPDMGQVVSGSEDGKIRVWDMTMGRRLRTLEGSTEEDPILGHGDGVSSVAISPNSNRVASGSHDSTVLMWTTDRGLQRLEDDPAGIDQDAFGTSHLMSVQFSPDSKQIVSVHYRHLVRLWDATTGRYRGTLDTGDDCWIRSVAFSPDSKQLMSVSNNGVIQAWDTATGRHLRTHMCNSVAVSGFTLAAFSPCIELVALKYHDTVWVWDTATGSHWLTLKVIQNYTNHRDGVSSLSVSPDKKRIATGHEDGAVQIWDTAIGMCLRTIQGDLYYTQFDRVHAVAFSPSSEWIAAMQKNGVLRAWNMATGEDFQSKEHVPHILAWDLAGLQTSRGMYNGLPKVSVSGIGISRDMSWILRNGEPHMWLPPDYRPYGDCAIAISGEELAFGCESGRVLCFRLSSNN